MEKLLSRSVKRNSASHFHFLITWSWTLGYTFTNHFHYLITWSWTLGYAVTNHFHILTTWSWTLGCKPAKSRICASISSPSPRVPFAPGLQLGIVIMWTNFIFSNATHSFTRFVVIYQIFVIYQICCYISDICHISYILSYIGFLEPGHWQRLPSAPAPCRSWGRCQTWNILRKLFAFF